MENKDEIIQLVTGNLKCDPRDEVIAQLNTDEEARDEYNKIKNAWALVSSTNKMPEYQIESLYSDFRKQLDARQKSSRIFYLSVLKYAAMAIFVLSLGGLVGYYISMQNPQYADSGIQKNSSLKGSVSIVI